MEAPAAEAPSLRHLHHFVGSFPAAAALLGHRLFPDAKEVAESMGALNACRPLLRLVPDPGPQDAIICIGDGFAPRGAALFAAATEGWSCVSCDPGLPAPLEVGPLAAPLATAAAVYTSSTQLPRARRTGGTGMRWTAW